jgi:ABC-type bacteriocin/lantibiotic exporter with double-glycine peptidase domain
MFVKAAAVNIAMIIIMFTYSWKLTLIALCFVLPNVSIGRMFYQLFMDSNEKFQTAKADLGSVAQEAFGNIRTLKAFANEVQTLAHYEKENQIVYKKGMYKAYVFGGFYFTFTLFQNFAFCGLLYVVSRTYGDMGLTLGTVMAYLLYMKKIVDAFGEMMNAY